MGGDSGGRLHAFRSLAGNRALVRVLTGYALFVLTEYSAWIAVLVFAYSHGGATVAGVVAVAQLVPGAILAPVMAAVADRRSPVVLLAGGYLVQAAGMAAAAAAIFTGVPVAVYVSAVIACVAQTTVRRPDGFSPSPTGSPPPRRIASTAQAASPGATATGILIRSMTYTYPARITLSYCDAAYTSPHA